VKNIIAIIIYVLLDLAMIAVSIIFACELRNTLVILNFHLIPCETYLHFYPIYIIPVFLFAYSGIYTYRYDFWHESRLIIKAIIFAAILTFAYLALTKTVENYSRLVVGLTFVLMVFFIPLAKNISKKLLYKLGLWQKKAAIYGDDPFLIKEIYGNPYLGYIQPEQNEEPATVFINSQGYTPDALKSLITAQMRQKHEVIFIPLVNDYDLTHSHIYELANTHTNLIVYKNRIKSRYRMIFQQTYNYLLAILSLPVFIPIIAIFAVLIKSESKGPIFFKHTRIGKNGRKIPTYKFRSMYVDADERLKELLKTDPEAKKEWEKCFKLKNDPRVTKIGAFLRSTSLDELPQIFNVLRGEMNFVGPRPVLQEELDRYYKDKAEYYYMVKPGITGLWQVSGRSDTDYESRVALDKWYVLNWSLWLDIVILLKTIKVVLKRDGAY
jgi:undecaprenyl-phosphate galactose phosphotransferase